MERLSNLFSYRPRLPQLGNLAMNLRSRRTGLIAAVIAGILVLYYPVGMALVHQINDDMAYTPTQAEMPEGKSVV